MILFETSVIGSLPRPSWILQELENIENGLITEENLQSKLDEAIPLAITLQELAGIDVITDGEWRRKSYIQGFSKYVKGFENNKIEVTVLDGTKRYWPAIVRKLEYVTPIAVSEVSFVKKLSSHKVKATLPSPYMIERWFYDPDFSKDAYKTREELIEDVANILRIEINNLINVGVDTIQFDDAMIGRLIGKEYNSSGLNPKVKITLADRERELELAIHGINCAVDGVKNVQTGIHVCRGHRSRKHVAQGSFEPIFGALSKMNLDIFALEFASEPIEEIKVLRLFPQEKKLGMGAIDVLSEKGDEIERIVSRVEEAMKYVDKERISLNPDCGFAPSSENPITIREAALKLKKLGDAATLLRDKYTH
jgi:5-methyltetrahydropteroyltriglutamate--homocysteine methyltransferase